MPWPIHHWKNPSEHEVSFSKHSNRWWVPPSLPFSGYWELFPQRYKSWYVRPTTLLHLVPKSRINGTTPPLTLYDLMAFTGTTFTPPYYSLLSQHFHWQVGLNQYIPPWEHDVLHKQVNLSGITISFISSSHALLLFIYPVESLSHRVNLILYICSVLLL